MPPTTSPLWILFQLYFNCLLGRGLEQQWGVFRFNLYYLCGMVGAILAALLTGYGTNNYLNLSLFFAFAAFYPDYKLLIFFILPVKIKYLAILDGVLYLLGFVFGTWASRAAILLSLVNVVIFFGGSGLARLKTQIGYWENEAQLPQIYEIDCRAAASPAPAAPLRTAGAFLRFSKKFFGKSFLFPVPEGPLWKTFSGGTRPFPAFPPVFNI